MDFDLPDSFPARSRSTTGSTDSSSVRDLSRTVRTDPSGKGTVTHLAAKPPSLPAPTVRAKAKAIEKAWEAYIELDAFKIPRKVLAFPARKRSIMPDADDLEDLGFDLCDDLDQSTIKIDATLRQKLPPPQGRAKTKNNPPYQDTEDPEADFILPLNLTNLSLATQQPYKSHARPRVSNSSTATDLDSPNTSASGKKSGSWADDSPKRFSETSATSISDSLFHSQSKDKSLDENDMETGLILPDPKFFSSGNTRKLEAILDRKRKPLTYTRLVTRNLFTGQQFGDESFEDGLVLENPRVELSNGRLSRNKRARGANGPTARKTSGGKEKTEREKAWEKSREQGWGRVTPLPLPTRGSGFRSHSATTTALTGSLREKDASRLRASLDAVAMPPPPNAAPAATTPSRLRHQKSHYNMGPPPSPSSTLTRKQSLASLQDSLPSPTSSAPELRTPARYHYSSSRLTLPTASSLARTRAPVRGIFPESSSASSMSTSGTDRRA